mmetsp:Transcript_66130/g.159582  ORF Transcript_66130/g.159582 Transcript_66130/m.159582 type:complete len:205 (-) Transcript_66130:676-1290(-)
MTSTQPRRAHTPLPPLLRVYPSPRHLEAAPAPNPLLTSGMLYSFFFLENGISPLLALGFLGFISAARAASSSMISSSSTAKVYEKETDCTSSLPSTPPTGRLILPSRPSPRVTVALAIGSSALLKSLSHTVTRTGGGIWPPSASLNWSRSPFQTGLISFRLKVVQPTCFSGPSWSSRMKRTYGSEPPAASASGTPMAEIEWRMR